MPAFAPTVHRFRLVAVLLICLVGGIVLPVSPVVAQNCAAIGPGAFLAGCDLSGMDLSGMDLSGANLRGANLEGTNLSGANLSGANLSNATLTEGALDRATTAGANLRGIAWVPDSTVTLSFLTPVGLDGWCGVRVDVAGFRPGSFDLQFASPLQAPLDMSIVVGANGTGVYESINPERTGGTVWLKGDTVTATVNGVSSAPTEVAC
jgi:hypothetical protein